MKRLLTMIFVTMLMAAVPNVKTMAYENPRELVNVLEPDISEEDMYNLALLVLGEAEGENEEGKRWVIDVVLNRADSNKFPNDISEVIYQKKGGYWQFSGMSESRQEKVQQKVGTQLWDDVILLIKEELLQRETYDALYFRNKHYHNFGEPIKQVGNHFFSR